MKAKQIVLALAMALILTPGLRAEEWTGRFPYGVAPLKLSLVKPIQIPIPWYGYRGEASEWGTYSITGIDIGLEGDSANVYGLSLGGLMWGSEDMMGLDIAIATVRHDVYGLQIGLLNFTDAVRGVQIGISNSCHDLKGIQVGLLNFNFGGPLKFFPFINAGF